MNLKIGKLSARLKNLFGGSGNSVPAAVTTSQIANLFLYPDAFGKGAGFSYIYNNFYKTNPDVFACVRRIAVACQGIPFVIKEYVGDRWKVIKDPNNNLVRILNKPNPVTSGGRFREALVSHYLLAGNAYILKAGTKTSPELWLLPPQHVEVERGEKLGEVKRIIYNTINGKMEYSPEDVKIITYLDPFDIFSGFSPLVPAILSIAMGNEARRWNINLLKNNCRIPAVLKTEHHLNEQQIKQYKKILEEDYSGASNAGKMLVLTGGFDIKEFSYNPKDLDWNLSIALSTQEICRVFNVRPEVIGHTEQSNYYSDPQARLSFYQETVLPLMHFICDELTHFLIDEPTMKVDYDRDGIEALSSEHKDHWRRIIEAVSFGLMSPNDAAEALGITPSDVEAASKLYMTRNLAPIEDLGLVGSIADNIPSKPRTEEEEEEEEEETENREEEEYANSRRNRKETAADNR